MTTTMQDDRTEGILQRLLSHRPAGKRLLASADPTHPEETRFYEQSTDPFELEALVVIDRLVELPAELRETALGVVPGCGSVPNYSSPSRVPSLRAVKGGGSTTVDSIGGSGSAPTSHSDPMKFLFVIDRMMALPRGSRRFLRNAVEAAVRLKNMPYPGDQRGVR